MAGARPREEDTTALCSPSRSCIVTGRIGSAALFADGLHARTDGFTSLAVVFGAIGVRLDSHWPTPSSACSSR